MALRVIGSGLGRTGTTSLKIALEKLLGGTCHHMSEVVMRPDQPEQWTAAFRGEPVDWDEVFDGFVAAVDWPSAARWKELADHWPDAIILHSERPIDDWYRSATNTIFNSLPAPGSTPANPWEEMAIEMITEFTPAYPDEAAVRAAYDAWNADVRATAPADRLVIAETGVGWEPLCDALGLPVPDEPYPHANTTADFRKMVGLD